MLNSCNDINEFDEFEEYDDNNILQDDVIYEMNDNASNDAVIIYRNNSSNLSDGISSKTYSSIENDLEAIMYNYTIIIDCLTSKSYQRSQSEIAILAQLLQSLPDFMYVNATELEYVCQAAKLVCIDCAGQIIVRKCSVLREWYLCLEGSLRREDSTTTVLGPGAFAGTDLWSKEILISDYDLYSNCDNCKLLVIAMADLEPMNQLNNLIIKTSDEDKTVIAVYEAYTNMSATNDMCSYVLTKGTIDILISHLFSNPKWVSTDFVEDFFLTHKLFLKSTKDIRNEIASSIYLDNEYSKDKFNILIRWMTQNFPNFERNQNKLRFIDQIIGILKNQNNDDWLYTLYECCSNSSKVRHITETISLKDYIVPVKISNKKTIFYMHGMANINTKLRNGDVILELEGKSNKAITLEIIKFFSDERKPIDIYVRNDLLGYHEHVLKDISLDTVSVHSTPSNTIYSQGSSEKISDSTSLSANDSDNCSPIPYDKTNHSLKRPVILPNLFSTLHTGTIGKFFKNPKQYGKSAMANGSLSISDVPTRLENGNRDLAGSTFSISRFSRRLKSKRRRRSVGSNADLIKSFDDMGVTENNLPTDSQSSIRIYIRDIPVSTSPNATMRPDQRYFHIVIEPSTTVTEIIVRTLLKLNLSSAKSTEYFFVEITIDETNGMVHEKSLHPDTSNLLERLTEHTRFYLKHFSVVGESLILQSEADKMRENFKSPRILQLSLNNLIVRLFLRSYKHLSKIQPYELIAHVAGNKATLKYHKERIKSKNELFEYMHLSDFYKYWVITEVCTEESNIMTRASTISYFIHLALKAMYIGHIDLFFSIISGLDSTEVLRLNATWDKVPKRDKKLLENLETTLDVSGNMRNLRIIHQRISSPQIPVTAMVIKDLTMLEETHPTYASNTINDRQVNPNLVNFDKMRKMSGLARIFVNSSCSCGDEKSRPVKKHSLYCNMKWENHDKLERLLQQRLKSHTDKDSPKLNSHSMVNKHHRKYSYPNNSLQSSSTESLSDSVSPSKSNEENTSCQIFEQRMMTMKVERYLTTLDDRVVIDERKLSEMSLFCEPNNQIDRIYETKLKNSSKNHKNNDLHDKTIVSPYIPHLDEPQRSDSYYDNVDTINTRKVHQKTYRTVYDTSTDSHLYSQ